MAKQPGAVDDDLIDWTSYGNSGQGGGGSGEFSQTSKRGWEDSAEEEDRIVRRKVENREYKVILKFKDGERIKSSVVALSTAIKKKVGEVSMAKTLRDGSLLIICTSEEQKRKALRIEKICETVVVERKIVGESKVVRGVITGIPVGEDLGKLKQNICGGTVEKLKRLMRTVEGQRVESMSLLVEFGGDALPGRVLIGCMSYPVRPYVPPPLRCFKCQRYGHVAAVCRGNQRCPRCGGDHRFEECRNEAVRKCCNCGGEHAVTFGGCEVRKRAVEIQQVKTTSNVTYAEAVKKVQGQSGGHGAKGKVVMTQNLGQGNEQLFTMQQLILFMSYVINCTNQAKGKTERIRIVVKGAEKYLGVRGVSMEHISKKLEEDGRTGDTSAKTV